MSQGVLPQARSGFTLVELLAVIAIIAILASLLTPVIARSTRQARAADSVNNARQIAAAAFLYAGDHDGRLCGDSYPDHLIGYLQNKQDPRTVFISKNADQSPRAVGSTIPITYSVHGNMFNDAPRHDGLGRAMSLMRQPAKLILVADGNQAPVNYMQPLTRFLQPAFYVNDNAAPALGTYDTLSEAELRMPLEDNWGWKGIGPDASHNNAGWFRYCNDGAVAAAFGDGHGGLIKKGEVLAENLVAF